MFPPPTPWLSSELLCMTYDQLPHIIFYDSPTPMNIEFLICIYQQAWMMACHTCIMLQVQTTSTTSSEVYGITTCSEYDSTWIYIYRHSVTHCQSFHSVKLCSIRVVLTQVTSIHTSVYFNSLRFSWPIFKFFVRESGCKTTCISFAVNGHCHRAPLTSQYLFVGYPL